VLQFQLHANRTHSVVEWVIHWQQLHYFLLTLLLPASKGYLKKQVSVYCVQKKCMLILLQPISLLWTIFKWIFPTRCAPNICCEVCILGFFSGFLSGHGWFHDNKSGHPLFFLKLSMMPQISWNPQFQIYLLLNYFTMDIWSLEKVLSLHQSASKTAFVLIFFMFSAQWF